MKPGARSSPTVEHTDRSDERLASDFSAVEFRSGIRPFSAHQRIQGSSTSRLLAMPITVLDSEIGPAKR